MSPDLDPYFRDTTTWPQEKRRLREVLSDYPLSEELKWREPCYTFQGANVAIVYGMKDSCGLGFFKGALLDDPHGVLIPPGKNTQAARRIHFTSVEEIDEKEAILRAIVESAIKVEQAGLKVDFKARHELVFPQELLDAFDSNPDFAVAFEALTPGRQRGYNLFFTGAKQSKTRVARIEKHMARIFEGKGMHDR